MAKHSMPHKMCGHGKSLDVECLACAMIFRIEEKQMAELAALRCQVADLQRQLAEAAS